MTGEIFNESRTTTSAPIVHLNGTSKSRLLENLSEVYSALLDLETTLKGIAPNGRDYYPIPGAFDKAVEQHRCRLKAVGALRTSIEIEIDIIEAQ